MPTKPHRAPVRPSPIMAEHLRPLSLAVALQRAFGFDRIKPREIADLTTSDRVEFAAACESQLGRPVLAPVE